MNTNTLQSLLGSDSSPRDESPARPPRRHFSRLFPWLLLIAFAGLIAVLFGETLLPAREVRLESVVTVRAGESEATVASSPEVEPVDPWEAPVQFQASGWIEPDPLPIKATSLVDGVVDTVGVLEGEKVEKGQLLATLIREDFELDLATAKSKRDAYRASLSSNEASIAMVDAKMATLEKRVEAGNMRCRELQDQLDRLRRAGAGAVAGGEIEQTRLRLQTHAAEVEALAATRGELKQERSRLVAEAEQIEAHLAEAETEVARRKLALERTRIHSPVDGIVLRLHAVPGQKRMLGMEGEDSSTIAVLYQPDFLQARIDVPLEEAGGLSVGQHVRMRTAFLPGENIRGVVTRIVGEADLQRNTLQAKVRIQDPDPRLRPDMLCRAEFLAPVSPEGGGSPDGASGTVSASGRISLYVPASALVGREGDTARVWVPDAGGERLQQRTIEIGARERDGHYPVRDGLRPGERVVVDPPSDLETGERFRALENTSNAPSS